MLERKWGARTITNDGVSIASEIDLEDPQENIGGHARILPGWDRCRNRASRSTEGESATTEVMVNGPDEPTTRMVPRERIEKMPESLFEGEEAVLQVIERIVAPLGLRVDELSPWVDARLSGGSRVQPNFFGPDSLRDPEAWHPLRLIRQPRDRAASGPGPP